MCPALRGSTVSYAGDAHFAKHSLEYSLNFWSQPKKKGGGDVVAAYRSCCRRHAPRTGGATGSCPLAHVFSKVAWP